MKEKSGFLLYIDLLGYKDILNKNNSEEDERLKSVLKHITEVYLNLNFTLAFGQCYNKKKMFQRFFSDNFLFVYESDRENISDLRNLMFVASYIQYQFLLTGILTRGAITYGTIYYTDNLVYGLDLIKVVEMEQSHKEPSVVVDNQFRTLFENDKMIFTNTVDLFMVQPSSAPDLNGCIEGIKKYINNLNKSYVDGPVLDKINWVIEKVNDYFGKKQKVQYELKSETKYFLVEKE